MLPKKNRLKKEKDFEKVFKKGKGLRKDFLFLKLLNNNLKKSRFGIVVSTKISKKATVRNKTRRRIREIIRNHLDEIKKGKDIVIVAQPGIEEKSFSQIKETLIELFKKAKLI